MSGESEDVKDVWEKHRVKIQDLYMRQNKSLEVVRATMERENDFTARCAHLFFSWQVDAGIADSHPQQISIRDTFENVGILEKIPSTEWSYIQDRSEKRKRDGKESDVHINALVLPPKKVKRELSRRFLPSSADYAASGACIQTILHAHLLRCWKLQLPQLRKGSVCRLRKMSICRLWNGFVFRNLAMLLSLWSE